jgi:Domain of unknown function (DUF6285)
MTERPEAADLLDEARRTLLEILLPLLPQERRYDALMVANAMAIAAREHRAGDGPLREETRGLATLSAAPDAMSGPPAALSARRRDLQRQLAQDIRQGRYDTPGAPRDAVRRYLRASTEGRVRLSNPKVLGGS